MSAKAGALCKAASARTRSGSFSKVDKFTRIPFSLNIDLDRVAVQFHQFAPGGGFALAHQFGDQAFGL